MRKLRLFVWTDVLVRYPRGEAACPGVMLALAPDVETARKQLLKTGVYIPGDDLAKEPDVYDEPFAIALWGGG